ncbi:MAG: hypothetical protein ACKO3R_00945, partial [bacterium]
MEGTITERASSRLRKTMNAEDGRVAKRTSSRLRRTNDRSAISSDAEDATPVSYASKRKYKLRLLGVH